MANRFPLIVNAADAKIYELAAGDNLDLTSSNIYNNGATIALPTASGTLATLAGTETLTNKTLSSGTLSGTFAGDATLSGSITLSATTALTIPVGTTAQRPTAATGQIRFNSSLTSFEGYNGTAWSSLGGVKSVDGFTYIIAETSSGASNGELEFYTETAAGTAAAKQGGWNYTRLLTNTPIDFAGSTSGTTRVQATAAASGILTLPAATDTLVGKATTDTLTNKTINLANNTLTATSAQILAAVSDETGSGSLVFGTSPSFTTSVLTGSTSFNVFNTTATTINAFGAATAISLGASTGTTTVNNNLTVTGNLVVNGTTTTINSTTLTVDDIVVELGDVATPTDTTANGGGILLKGATNKTFLWQSATGAWTSSEDLNLASGKVFEINGTTVLSGTTLGSGVTASSLTSVGTVTSGTWSASFGAVSGANLTNLTAGNLAGTIPSAVLGNSTAYIGTTAVALNRASANLALTGISSVTLPGSTSGSVQIVPTAAAGTGTVLTLPATTGTVITSGDTGTVTSTMIADGTIVNGDISASAAIAVSKLAASTISGITLGNNLNTLTLNVSGTGLSGSTTYNGSAAATFTVTSNATSANTASTVVARDASGNFSAGTITASLSGTATQVSNSLTAGTGLSGTAYNGSAAQTWSLAASGVTAGSYGSATAIPVLTIDSYGRVTAASTSSITVGNGTLTMAVSGTGLSGSASFTANASGNSTFTVTSNATSANTASTIVARDANGDFTAGTVTAVDGFQATSAAPFFLNATTVAANFTIPTNYNAMSAGPVTIADGVTVTVPDGSVWTIV